MLVDARGGDDAEPAARPEELAHHRARHQEYISADQPADDILREIRRQGALSIACHPHHRPPRRFEISTCYLWDHRDELSDLVDVWEAANRDDLFPVTSLKHYPYMANSDFHKPKHLYSWKTLIRCEKNWPADQEGAKEQRRRGADAVPQRLLGRLTPTCYTEFARPSHRAISKPLALLHRNSKEDVDAQDTDVPAHVPVPGRCGGSICCQSERQRASIRKARPSSTPPSSCGTKPAPTSVRR